MWVMQWYHITGVGFRPKENALDRSPVKRQDFFYITWIYMLERLESMDMLKKTAIEFNKLLSINYYFEIAKKQNLHKLVLSFEKSDFYHLSGLHKLTDIAALQREPNKGKIFDNILDDNITYNLIKRSRFFTNMNVRLELSGKLEEILDSNQIVFKYLSSKHRNSCIEADFLLEEAYGMNIVFMFLDDRNKAEKLNIPYMCCRSFFPMENFDYTIDQPSYTLIKKIKIDTIAGNKILQYDRSKIIEESKKAVSEPERRSILQQLNEKKAQQAVSDILSEKRRKQQDYTRF